MAKAHIPEGVRLEEAAAELAKLGITLGQRLTDGTYRAYVLRKNIPLFLQSLNQNNYEGLCKSSVSSLTQLDEAEAPKIKFI